MVAYPTVDNQNQPATGVCDLATSASKRTLPMPSPVEWAPDSQALTYFEPRRNSGVFVQPIDGGVPRQLTQFPTDGQQLWDLRGQRMGSGSLWRGDPSRTTSCCLGDSNVQRAERNFSASLPDWSAVPGPWAVPGRRSTVFLCHTHTNCRRLLDTVEWLEDCC
jgi:hypothetical protein